MKKIIVPLDFSPASLNAFTYALHFAKKINAEIVTVHIYELPGTTYLDLQNFIKSNYDIKDLTEFENYNSKVPKLWKIAEQNQLTDINLSHVLQPGNVVDSIVEVAKKERADYIIMGTNGASGIKELFFGSVTEKVINNTPVPLLAIPPQCLFTDIDNILFLTKYTAAELQLLDDALKLSSLFNARLEALQVKANYHLEDQMMLQELKSKHLESNVRFTILETDAVEQTVLEFIKMNKIDMTILTVQHKTLIEKLFLFSMTSRMAFHATVPILSLPIKKQS